MNQKHPYASGLLALGISFALQTTALASADAPSASPLMSEAEIAAHKSSMAALEGRARDEYRDAQYEQLKRRAREQGFSLPDQPPWANAAASAAVPTETTASMVTPEENAAAEAEARHDAMREKLQALKPPQKEVAPVQAEPAQAAAEAQPPSAVVTENQPKASDELPSVPAPSQTGAAAKPAPSAPAVARMPAAPAPAAPPAPSTPPTPPTPPAVTGVAQSGEAPRFAPVEVAPPPPVAPVTNQPSVATSESRVETPAISAPDAGGTDAMEAYRENMRTQFDEYMKQRQEQMEENARRQREQHQAAMEQRRARRANRAPYPQYPYPAAPPSYGPRYPAAYPGYRAPYWEQQ